MASPPVITASVARHVLAGYAAAVSRADMLRERGLLVAAEAGSSYQMDAGEYQWTRVSDPGNRSYWALSAAHPAFYIPRQAAGPAWWVATAAWMQPRKPGTRPVPAYLVFSQEDARWMQVLEPDPLAGGATIPRVATGRDGYAAAITSAAATRLAVPPDQIAAATAGYLNGQPAAGPRCPRPGACRATTAPRITMASVNGLADMRDQAFWARRLPAGSTDTDLHSVTHDPTFAISTTGGGALVFYDLSAHLELAPPAGFTFRIAIPGFYSAMTPRAGAGLTYVEQFAAYDPPRGGVARVVADVGGPVSAG